MDRLLLQAGARALTCTNGGGTASELAYWGSHKETATILKEAGA
jgi:hypothetical protein